MWGSDSRDIWTMLVFDQIRNLKLKVKMQICKFIRGLGPLACLPQETPDSASLPAAKLTLPNHAYLLKDMT